MVSECGSWMPIEMCNYMVIGEMQESFNDIIKLQNIIKLGDVIKLVCL